MKTQQGWTMWMIGAALGLSLALVGCEKKEEPAGSLQQMGAQLDAAAEEGQKAAADATVEAGKAVEQAGKEVQEAAK